MCEMHLVGTLIFIDCTIAIHQSTEHPHGAQLMAACRCLELTDHKPEYAILGWVNGWLNVLGQFATTAFAADILASHIASIFALGNGHAFTSIEMLLAYAGRPLSMLACHCPAGNIAPKHTQYTSASKQPADLEAYPLPRPCLHVAEDGTLLV